MDARALDAFCLGAALDSDARTDVLHADDEELLPLAELVSSDDVASLLAHAEWPSGTTTPVVFSAPQEPTSCVTSGLSTTTAPATAPSPALPRSAPSLLQSMSPPRLTDANKLRSGTKHALGKMRNERKSERIYLQNQVSALETQLRSLQAQQPKRISSHTACTLTAAATGETQTDSTQTDSESATMCLLCHDSAGFAARLDHRTARQRIKCPHAQMPTTASVWQDIATRQREERVAAEKENIRLKLVLADQLKIAKNLETILNKRATTKGVAEFAQCRHRARLPSAAFEAMDVDVSSDLVRDVERMRLDIDAVYEANGLAGTETPLRTAHMHSDVLTGVALEVIANKVLPFDVQATSDAVWRHFALAKECTPCRGYTYSAYEATDNLVTESFILTLNGKDAVAHFRVKQVLKRHVEAERVVIVWRAAVEAVEFSNEPVANVRFHENGYIVVKQPRALARGEFALLQTCYIYTPSFGPDVTANSSHPSGGAGARGDAAGVYARVGAITDFLVEETTANIAATHQRIENVLIEQALKRSA